MKKILILFGGPSDEHLISCKSAKGILENIDYKKYDVKVCGITKDNTWYLYNDTLDLLDNGTWINSQNNEYIENIIDFLKEFDAVFPIIHGKLGEDGKLEALFETFNIKYVGSPFLSHAIGMDKYLTKLICNSYNISQTNYVLLRKNTKSQLKYCEEKINYPMIVKPTSNGSSIGINIANNRKELEKAIKIAFKYDTKVLVEKFIKAKELECAIIYDKNLIASTVGEIIPSNSFYDYDAKYEKESPVVIPASIDEDLALKIKQEAIYIFEILGCKDYARIDFLYDYENDILYFNEINTIPGFTKISMYTKLLDYDGINYKKLITKLIENALNK